MGDPSQSLPGRHEPRYQSLGRLLKEQIVTGKYPADSRVPSEHQIAARFSVSRVTARQAIQLLEAEGLVRRIRGSGTYVNRLGPGSRRLVRLQHAALLAIDLPPAPAHFLQGMFAAERWLAARGGSLALTECKGSDLLAGRLPPVLKKGDIQGLLINGIVTDVHIRVVRNLGLPFMVAGNSAISRSVPQIRYAVGAMVRRAITFISSRFPKLPIVMIVDASTYHFRKEALAAYRQAIRAAPQHRPRVIDWAAHEARQLKSLADDVGPCFAVITPHRDLDPLIQFYRQHEVAPRDQVIVQISSPEMVPPHERAGRYFIPASSDKMMTAAVRALAEMVETGRGEHYQEIDAEIEMPS